jgi:O-antigen/teichoic acid export membrane protein
MAKLGVNLSFASIAGSLVSQLDKVLIFHFLGAGPVAVYALAQAPVVQLRAVLKLSTPLSLPKLAAMDRSVIAKNLEGKLDRFLIGTIVMAVAYIAFAPLAFRIFFPKYLDAVPYSQVYALLLLLFPKKLIPLTLFAQEERRGLYPLSISTPIVQTILLFVLVPTIGLWGAVVAEVGGSLASNFLANYYLRLFKRGTL